MLLFISVRSNQWMEQELAPVINPPPPGETSRARYLAACLFALEPSIEGVVAGALQSGWKREYVLLAIMTLVMHDGDEMTSPTQSRHS